MRERKWHPSLAVLNQAPGSVPSSTLVASRGRVSMFFGAGCSRVMDAKQVGARTACAWDVETIVCIHLGRRRQPRSATRTLLRSMYATNRLSSIPEAVCLRLTTGCLIPKSRCDHTSRIPCCSYHAVRSRVVQTTDRCLGTRCSPP